MKAISRYVSLISLSSVLASGALLAQTSSSSAGTNGTSVNSAASGSLGARAATSGSALAGTTDPLVSSIQTGDYNSRAQVASDIEQRLDSQKDLLKTLKSDGKRLQGQSRSEFNTAYDEVQAREKDLKRSLREARNASADKWESARAELAANYQAFTVALARAESQVGLNVNSSNSSSPSSATSDHSLNRSTETPHTNARTTTGALPNDPAAATP